jgi:hypothetical protein
VEDETREREQQMFEEHLQQQKKLLSELKQREVDLLRSQYNVRRQQCIEQMVRLDPMHQSSTSRET